MLLAALSFTAMVSCVKVARTELSAFDIVWWRGLVSVPLCALAVGRGPWKIHRHGLFSVRVGFGFMAMACYFQAAGGLALANLTLIQRLQPITIALLAPLILGAQERVDRRTWLLSGVGVAGCAVLLAPEVESGNPAGWVALGAVATSAVSHIALRGLGATERPATLVFWFQLFVTLAALAWVGVRDGALPVLPGPDLLPWLVGVGVFAALGQSLLTRAYQLDRAALVAAASHASPFFAIAIDIVAFGTPPGSTTLLGGALVLAAAIALVIQGRRPPPAVEPSATPR